MTDAQDAVAVAELEEHLRGEVVRPNHDRYDALRAVWNGMISRRPRVIARCTGVADVRAALDYARGRDLSVAVRSAWALSGRVRGV